MSEARPAPSCWPRSDSSSRSTHHADGEIADPRDWKIDRLETPAVSRFPKGTRAASSSIYLLKDGDLAQRFTNALRAEGIHGAGYAKPCISMREWGLHWYFNNKSLVNRRSLHSSGWPWTFPQNAFAADYNYGEGRLPTCDDSPTGAGCSRSLRCLTETDIQEIVDGILKRWRRRAAVRDPRSTPNAHVFTPTHLIFGQGCSGEVAERVKALGGTRRCW